MNRRRLAPEKMKSQARSRYWKDPEAARKKNRKRYHEGGGKEKAKVWAAKNANHIKLKGALDRRPVTAVGWCRRVINKIRTNIYNRNRKGLPSGVLCSSDVVLAQIKDGVAAGDLSFTDEWSFPSPDRINPRDGYSDDNIQIVPAWLNYAYHDWDKSVVDAAILGWAAKRIGVAFDGDGGNGLLSFGV